MRREQRYRRWWKKKWLPWPSRRERKTAVSKAETQADESRRRAAHARKVARELRQLQQDRVSEVIVRDMIDRGNA